MISDLSQYYCTVFKLENQQALRQWGKERRCLLHSILPMVTGTKSVTGFGANSLLLPRDSSIFPYKGKGQRKRRHVEYVQTAYCAVGCIMIETMISLAY
jgi:hypothetical protein